MADKTKQIAIRVTEEEAEEYRKAAERDGLSVSEFLRTAGTSCANREMYTKKIYKILLSIQAEYERITASIQTVADRNADNLGDIVEVRFWKAQLITLNKQLHYIQENMKEFIAKEEDEFKGGNDNGKK